MSWGPRGDSEHATRDDRLDGYRDRAAVVRDGDRVVLTLYARHSLLWHQLGGHLWWRRWSGPEEILVLLGEDSLGEVALDAWISGDELSRELSDWSRGVFRFRGVVYEVEWLTDAESDVVRRRLEA